MNIVLIGAHPDDCELKAGGTCTKWIEAGFNVHVVCMTNGDAGHYEDSGESLARRRTQEAADSAEVIGADSVVFQNHDGALLPTLEVREEVIALIRRFEADVVITHRPNDYHPDHRYTSLIVQDAAYMVTVPFVVPGTPALQKNPVFFYFMDHFSKPAPFDAHVAVAVDDAMETKWRMLDKMESQLYEWLPWHDGVLQEVPKEPDKRLAWLEGHWGPRFQRVRPLGEKALERWYGADAASTTQYVELFEVSEYGHQPNEERLRAIFPFLPSS